MWGSLYQAEDRLRSNALLPSLRQSGEPCLTRRVALGRLRISPISDLPTVVRRFFCGVRVILSVVLLICRLATHSGRLDRVAVPLPGQASVKKQRATPLAPAARRTMSYAAGGPRAAVNQFDITSSDGGPSLLLWSEGNVKCSFGDLPPRHALWAAGPCGGPITRPRIG